MKIIALMPCRNEDWVLGLSARAVLMWADELCILDHCSADASLSIAADVSKEFPGRVHIHRELNPVWEEMRHRQKLLTMAREHGATHIAMVDADEVLTSNAIPHIREMFEACPTHSILQLPWLALRGSIGQVHVAGPWAEGQNVSTGFVDAPKLHWTSETRDGYDFHHRHPMGRVCIPFLPIGNRNGGLMHLQFVSGRRLRAKQALYQMTEVLRWPGRDPVALIRMKYSLSVYDANSPDFGWQERMAMTIGKAPLREWWGAYEADNLIGKWFRPHATPWQEAEVLKLLEEHGPKPFAGLDLFGIGEKFHER